MESFIPFLLMGAVFWFLIIRPQMTERREHEELLESLAKDDLVITASGLWGRVVKVDETTVMLEVADRTRVKFDKGAVLRRSEAETQS